MVGYNAGMDEKYQLVFRGEVLDGQHRAVVKRRLMESLKLNEAQADRLFGGAAVVLKKSVDAKTAAGFQGLFKKAGARLRVHALAAEQGSIPGNTQSDTTKPGNSMINSATPATAAPPDTALPAATASAGPTFSLLSLEEIDQLVAGQAETRVEIDAPDFSVAEPGEALQEPREPVVITLPEADFSIAEPGVDLLDEPVKVEAVALGPLTFELAEVGATIGDDTPKVLPPAPDTSHLQIAEEA